jgi:translation initiation factor 3 subunit M
MVLQQTLEFAKQSRQLAALLVPVVKGKADEWKRVWNLKPSMALELYLQLAAIMKVVGDRPSVKEYLRLLSSALTLVDASEAAQLAKVKPFAVEAIKAFIRSPDIFQCDFWELPAVQQLSKDAASAPLLQLLNVVLLGDLQGFRAAATPAVLEGIGVSADAALDKMRLMALLVLGSKSSRSAVSFEEIQTALDIPSDQVQQWIMRAIGSKLIEGKIDQVAGTVTITRCHHRTFTSSEWQGLGQQLTALREALQGANDMLLAKQAAGSRAAAAGRPGAAQPVH